MSFLPMLLWDCIYQVQVKKYQRGPEPVSLGEKIGWPRLAKGWPKVGKECCDSILRWSRASSKPKLGGHPLLVGVQPVGRLDGYFFFPALDPPPLSTNLNPCPPPKGGWIVLVVVGCTVFAVEVVG